MGIVIDDAIHMIYRHRDAQKRMDFDSKEAAAYSVYRVGVPITTTTLILVVGFGAMVLSGFELNSTFGACSALILVCALVVDLILLPRMLVWATETKS